MPEGQKENNTCTPGSWEIESELASLRPLGEGGKMAYTSPMEIKLISLFVYGKEIKILYLCMKNNSHM